MTSENVLEWPIQATYDASIECAKCDETLVATNPHVISASIILVAIWEHMRNCPQRLRSMGTE